MRMIRILIACLAIAMCQAAKGDPDEFAPIAVHAFRMSDYYSSVVTQLTEDKRYEITVICFPSFRGEWRLSLHDDAIIVTEANEPIWNSSTNVDISSYSYFPSSEHEKRLKTIFKESLERARYQKDDRHVCDGEMYWLIDAEGTLAQANTPSATTPAGRTVALANAIHGIITNADLSDSVKESAIQKSIEEFSSQQEARPYGSPAAGSPSGQP